ncbi:MAG: dependent epimerase/dehydratase family protein [Nocardioides sp.]|nr:dependent epimerase/dehydratase family protein [Nocardioides sp.]
MVEPGPVLVTGASGLVGRAVVARLEATATPHVATDLVAPAGSSMVAVDLTRRDEVVDLVGRVRPSVVVHLAAVIPPLCYRRPDVAQAVNVDAVATLVDAVSDLPEPPRWVQASSVAVHGGRNPHRHTGLLTGDLPMAPTDLYGRHKAAAEAVVRRSALPWVVLRLGGVMTVEQRGLDLDGAHFGGLLPADARIQTVDVRDVAHAFVAATTADVVGETLMIGGDDTHRLRQRDISADMTAAVGMPDVLPPLRPGDPGDDASWFATDWMDTARAQEALGFQHHSWPAMLDEIRAATGWRRYPSRAAAPVVRLVLRRQLSRLGDARPW